MSRMLLSRLLPRSKALSSGTHLFQKAEKKKTKKSASLVASLKLDENIEDRLNALKDLLIRKLMTLQPARASQGA